MKRFIIILSLPLLIYVSVMALMFAGIVMWNKNTATPRQQDDYASLCSTAGEWMGETTEVQDGVCVVTSFKDQGPIKASEWHRVP